MTECRHTPAIAETSKSLKRSVSDLYQWQKTKTAKIAKMQEEQLLAKLQEELEMQQSTLPSSTRRSAHTTNPSHRPHAQASSQTKFASVQPSAAVSPPDLAYATAPGGNEYHRLHMALMR